MSIWRRSQPKGMTDSPRFLERPAQILAVLLFVLLVGRVTGLCGEIRVGIHGGLSIPNIRGNSEQSRDYKSRRGPFFGISSELGITPHFSLIAEVNYSSQGGKRDGMQPITADQVEGLPLPPGMTLYANFHNETILDYIEIPLMAKLSWGKRLLFFAEAGPYIGFRARAKTVTSGMSLLYLDSSGTPLVDPDSGQSFPPVSFDADTNIKNDINSTSAGITGGAGVAFPLGPGDISLSAQFSLGLSNIQSNPEINGEDHTGAVIILVGYSVAFGGKK